jgi:hypothetical protein
MFTLAAQTGYVAIEVLIDGRWEGRDANYLYRLSPRYVLPIAALHSIFVGKDLGHAPLYLWQQRGADIK